MSLPPALILPRKVLQFLSGIIPSKNGHFRIWLTYENLVFIWRSGWYMKIWLIYENMADIWKFDWYIKIWLIHENLVDIWKYDWYMKIWLIYAPASDLESDRFWRAEVFAGDGTRFLTFRASFRVRRMFKWCEPPTCALTFELTFRAGEVNNSTNLRRRTLHSFSGTKSIFYDM